VVPVRREVSSLKLVKVTATGRTGIEPQTPSRDCIPVNAPLCSCANKGVLSFKVCT
jgi:hypothetical protein